MYARPTTNTMSIQLGVYSSEEQVYQPLPSAVQLFQLDLPPDLGCFDFFFWVPPKFLFLFFDWELGLDDGTGEVFCK